MRSGGQSACDAMSQLCGGVVWWTFDEQIMRLYLVVPNCVC